ncbi:ABC transporter ATP-binding protein [Algoriphagus kandeliae]|uniref:ABC transporter ATP-binding protein n=1 Tax=Algoriphagus kandeliae TaxID=2562278 RepID=A0A4Y9QNI9_9BACT|nr:ABC transporter transmembrane domain-containing protein [Algoriphagus kandeliae]TFV93172.1 ABC transporter ATP-binding protein [Algoriphagus kandeliae]
MTNWIKNRTLRRLWFRKNPLLILIWAAGLISSLSTFLLSLMVGSFFDINYQEGISKTLLLEKFGIRIQDINLFFGIFLAVILVKFSLDFYERKSINYAAERMVSRLTSDLFSKQMNWSSQLFSEVPFGKYLLRYSGDMQSIRNMLVNGIFRGIRDSVFLLTGLFVLLWLNPIWTLTVLGMALLLFPIFLFLDRKQKPLILEKRNSKSSLINLVTESFGKHTQIQENKLIQRTIRRFKRKKSRVLTANLEYRKSESLRQSLITILSPALIFFLLLLIYFSPNSSTPGELLAFMLVLSALTPAIRNVIKAPNTIAKGMLSLEKVEILLRKKQRRKPKTTSKPVLIPLPKEA